VHYSFLAPQQSHTVSFAASESRGDASSAEDGELRATMGTSYLAPDPYGQQYASASTAPARPSGSRWSERPETGPRLRVRTDPELLASSVVSVNDLTALLARIQVSLLY
jgi:hypothetical protein